MSRIWKLPINIISGVNVSIKDNSITVKWPKWELNYLFPYWVNVSVEENNINVSILSDEHKNLWWLVRTLIFNMIEWVTKWYQKKLLVFWVWYNVKIQWKKLIFNIWLSHPVEFEIPDSINAQAEKDPKWSDILTISWIDKQLVWQISSKIRSLKIPEVYKGKWIRYLNEVIKLKAWKTAKK